MRRALFTLSMVLFVAGSASAQSEREIIDNLIFLAADLCVGPQVAAGLEDEVLDLLSTFPRKSCEKVCQLSEKTCKSTERAIDKCGKIFLKGSNAIAKSICKDGALACSPKDVVKQRFAGARAGFEARPSECGTFAAECFSACQ